MHSQRTINRSLTAILTLFWTFWSIALASGEESKQEEGNLNIKLRIKDSQLGKPLNEQGHLDISVKAKGLSQAQAKKIQGAINKMVESIADQNEEGLILKTIQDDQPQIIGARDDSLPSGFQAEQIEIHVQTGGVLVKKDNKTVMTSGDEIRTYLSEEKERFERLGLKPAILFRAEKKVRFKPIRRVINAGAAMGVNAITFAFKTTPGGEVKALKKEQEIESALPSIAPSAPLSILPPLMITIEANGNISLKNESGTIELLETDAKVSKLPKLCARIELYRSVAELTSANPVVELKVSPDALLQRVVGVLNALALSKINTVSFVENHSY